ncbi:MAG: MBL fold metallo-hydrolase [Calothrix sp. C42_A2020_038]|nr:MBL fold metallo-hydrolase [Calothrix sp. C42_A2020_038]
MSNFELSHTQSSLTDEAENSLYSKALGDFAVRFWGVRGLIPTPGYSTSRYGGNTACVEMFVASKHLIFDGGTGLRTLGKNLQLLEHPIEAHLFFTNSQSNRIQGFPFFAPAFVPNNNLYIYGSAASNGASIKQCLGDQMLQPHFPYPLQVMQSELVFCYLTPNQLITLDDVTITTALINQNQKSIGYRITWQKYSVAYVTDLSKCFDEFELANIIDLVQDADLLIANATYTELTPRKHHFDGLPWQAAVDLANKSGVKRLAISHHHPDDDDDFLDGVEAKIKSVFPEAVLAREGLVIKVEES